MQSQIEVDEEDLYTWGSRKGEQERQAKECMQKKYNRFKTLKVKIIKKRKEKPGRKKKRKGKENSRELQKSNVDAEVYNNYKKCD